MDLSLFSVGELTQPNTMKLHGEVNGNWVLLLIDNGASHNFIFTEVVQKWRLHVEPTSSYNV